MIQFENENIYLVEQVKNLNINLFPHQLSSIFQLEEREIKYANNKL